MFTHGFGTRTDTVADRQYVPEMRVVTRDVVIAEEADDQRGPDDRPSQRKRGAWPWLAGFGIVAALVLGVVAVSRSNDQPPGPSPAQIASTVSSLVDAGIADVRIVDVRIVQRTDDAVHVQRFAPCPFQRQVLPHVGKFVTQGVLANSREFLGIDEKRGQLLARR